MDSLGKTLIAIGLAIAGIGCLAMVLSRIPGLKLGRLPGDIAIQRDGFSFFAPITTSILLSLILSAILYGIRLFKR